MQPKSENGNETEGRAPRSDVLRNRRRLLEAARDVFAAGGADASLEAVARTAGLGIGTLYRHFPTREALFQAVYLSEVEQLTVLAETLDNDVPPGEALRLWLKACVKLVATKKGMLVALAPPPGCNDALYASSSEKLRASLSALLSRAVSAGEIRGDIASDDLMLTVIGLCYASSQPDWQSTVPRLIDVFVDGLKAGT